MGYVAVKGGAAAVLNAEKLAKYYRLKNRSKLLEVEQIRDQLRLAVDRVMSEGSLYAPDLAALAIKH
jgi:alpha-D-ribose 1-methylphosphonate 5-triphosphate synthase subunit PhnI